MSRNAALARAAEAEGDFAKSVGIMDRTGLSVSLVFFFATVAIVGAMIVFWLAGDQTRVRALCSLRASCTRQRCPIPCQQAYGVVS